MDGPGSNFGLERFREKRPPVCVCVCTVHMPEGDDDENFLTYLISHIERF